MGKPKANFYLILQSCCVNNISWLGLQIWRAKRHKLKRTVMIFSSLSKWCFFLSKCTLKNIFTEFSALTAGSPEDTSATWGAPEVGGPILSSCCVSGDVGGSLKVAGGWSGILVSKIKPKSTFLFDSFKIRRFYLNGILSGQCPAVGHTATDKL